MEDVLLDLLNSTPVIDGVPQDRLADPAEARAWLHEHGGGGAGPEERHAVREVRDVLQAIIRGEREADALTSYLDGVSYVPDVSGGSVHWVLQVPPERDLAVRAVLAWSELEKTGRLKPCENDECRLFLLDRSKAGNARWCSMATCGNRMKARRHYQRARETP
ncbi:CGNR zinc finger domain-containing protein [Actinomadura sp. DC4]|uniref:CGNR zinc finger domain-containing protein n=1 Tax=Actinomadura sp. DC4 TaxID=3055069 RepID=UPI0025B2612E|nr:CGNR zinc finger domain-containing protein [Actinomadura sp. DC4]MDN3354249.1 CGNR zinc finger domain-containing protein [Actinomadura sp. DC4]